MLSIERDMQRHSTVRTHCVKKIGRLPANVNRPVKRTPKKPAQGVIA
jgi:hypothetical protein